MTLYLIPEKNRNYVYSSPDATKVAYINADESFKDFEPTSFKAWFRDFRYLEDVNLNNLNASQVTDTSYMFESQYQGTSPSVVIDWQNADFSNLKNANKMFGYFGYQAKDMTLNLQGWQIGEADLSNSFTRLGQFADGDIVVDLTDWDTSRVIGMSEMFTYLGGGKETQYNNPSTRSDSITIRGLSNWDVSNVKTIEKIFQGVGRNSDSQDDFELNMDASNWNLASVETMAYALSGIGQINYNHGNCTSFDTTNVDFSDWKIPADVDVSSLVYSTCANLSSMSSWDVSEMTNMDYMFNYQRFVNPPDLSNWDTSKVETMDHTFQVAKVNRSIESWDVSNAKIMSYTFNQTDMLQENVDTVMLDLSSWDVSNVEDMTGMFYYYRANSQNTFLNIDWKDKTSKVKNMSSMFDSTCRGALNCIIIGIEDLNVSGVETMRSMFRGTGGLSLDLSKWDVSHVSNMEGMFEEAGASAPSINLNLSGWDLASVTNAQRMFSYLSCSSTSGCYVGDMKSRVNLNLQNWKNINFSLHDFFKYAGGNASTTKIDVTGWDTSNVTEMGGMFNGAGAQSTAWPIIGVEDFDTSNVEDMASMFSWTGHAAPTPPSYSAKTLDLSRWNVNNVTAVAEMFNGVGGLNKIDLSNWFNGQTVNDLAIGGMFYGSSVETINLTGWGTLTNPKASGEIVTKSGIFQNASNLRNIYVTNGWSIPRVSTPYNNPDLNDNTFKDATSLPGYDATKVSYEYARIDTGDGGYFTDSCEYYGTCTQNSGNSINPAPISGNSVNPSYSPSYSPSIVEPTEPTSEPTTSTPKTTPSTNNPQSGNTEPLGVTRREQVDRTDYALIIVVSTSIALVIIGALAIFFIEKRDKDDEDEL